tara:strand:+ start:380 stop:538 length:159 start_codon:yes stop_codon:yes gene_type:complete
MTEHQDVSLTQDAKHSLAVRDEPWKLYDIGDAEFAGSSFGLLEKGTIAHPER